MRLWLDRALAGLARFRVGALLAIAFSFLVIGIVSGVTTFRSISHDTDMVEHTMAVEAAINRAAALNERIETARRGFLLQPDVEFVMLLRATQVEFDREATRIRNLTRDHPIQQRRIAKVLADDEARKPVIARNIENPYLAASSVQALGLDREAGTIRTRSIRATLQSMRETESRFLSVRNQNQLLSLRQFYLIAGTSLVLFLSLLMATIGVVMRFNRQLSEAEQELRETNEGLEEAVAGRTAELTRANQEIQRFAYIVSHDLRSPLVNVLGFTSELEQARKTLRAHLVELYEAQPALRDENAWLAIDEDFPEAMGFIRTSTEKMDRLINSILDLSRQGRRTLTPEKLAMGQLVDGVVASLHQRAEDAGAEIVVKPVPDVESDRVAVEQILSNLVENALKYLSPKRRGLVTVQGMRQGKSVLIDVIDNGRGIDPKDHERVFDLFRRAGVQDQQGEGIGLANARALAYRLGGTLTVESKLDEGATFRLTLPAKFVAVEVLA